MGRFTRQGKAKYFFIPTVAGYDADDPSSSVAPTAPEKTAGTQLTKSIAAVAGWQIEGARVDTPDMASKFTSNIPGSTSVGDSSFTFYADDTADAVRTALPLNADGYVWIEKGTGKGDLFPVRVLSVGDEHSVGNDPARYTIGFAVTNEPAPELTVV